MSFSGRGLEIFPSPTQTTHHNILIADQVRSFVLFSFLASFLQKTSKETQKNLKTPPKKDPQSSVSSLRDRFCRPPPTSPSLTPATSACIPRLGFDLHTSLQNQFLYGSIKGPLHSLQRHLDVVCKPPFSLSEHRDLWLADFFTASSYDPFRAIPTDLSLVSS